MTFNVYYTDRVQPDSSAVRRVWYNEVKKDLYLELHGAVYQYANVPTIVADQLVNSSSVGRYYQDVIKRNYNPGSRLGPVGDLREIRELSRVEQAVVVNTTAYPGTLTLVDKPLKVDVPTPVLSLVKDVPVREDSRRKYDFVFTLESDSIATERKHTVRADTEDDALDELFALGDLLDQEIVPVSSTVYYD